MLQKATCAGAERISKACGTGRSECNFFLRCGFFCRIELHALQLPFMLVGERCSDIYIKGQCVIRSASQKPGCLCLFLPVFLMLCMFRFAL